MKIERPSSRLRDPELRIDGSQKVTGRARYAGDVQLDGMLYAATAWSPYPHAKIVRVNTTAARQLPGVHAVITGADVRPHRFGRRLLDWPVLAWDRALFVGDRVAAVAAETPRIAEAAAGLIDVQWDELPAVLTPEEALAPGAPVLHPDLANYTRIRASTDGADRPNLRAHQAYRHGDPEAGFAASAQIFTHEFVIPRVHHGYIEPHAAVVWLDGETVHVVSCNKAPFELRERMAVALGIPLESIVVEAPFVGGDFGGKGTSIDEYILYFLARATGRPVKHVMSYTEELRATSTRSDARILMRTGVAEDGRILAHRSEVLYNAGAYAGGMPVPTLLPGDAMLTLTCYAIPNVKVEARAVYTNTVPTGHFRAPGLAQNAFAAESHVDLIARGLGVDPLEFRLKNAARSGSIDVLGETWRSDKFVRVLETIARDRAGRKPLSGGHGRGVGVGMRHVGAPGSTSLKLTLGRDRTVDVLTGASEQGTGVHTVVQRIVADELGIPWSRVRVRYGDTAEALFDPGVGGSRGTPLVGGAALRGAKALREKVMLIASSGRREGGGSEDLATFDDAAAEATRDGPIEVVGEHRTEFDDANVYAYDVEVTVDSETGRVNIVDVLLVVTTGTILNPVAHRGQLEGAFVFGLGSTLMEKLELDEGRVSTLTLGDYKLPTIADVPPLRIVRLDREPNSGPFGAGSVGELANPGIGPAVANAIADAVGARVMALPITSESVWRALRDAGRPSKAT